MMNLNEREVNAEIALREASGLNRSSLQDLANLYVVRDHLLRQRGYDEERERAYEREQSRAVAPQPEAQLTGDYGDSDFLRAVSGKEQSAVWAIVDELMDALRVVNVRVYDNVMRKIQNL